MIDTSDKIEPIAPSATVVLVRDAQDGVEVLLVQRSKAVKHMGGMWVFPGGKVDPADYAGGDDPYEAALAAAIRETKEEVGLDITPQQLAYLSHWTTPVGAARRFATWFFIAVVGADQQVEVDGGEISRHRWVRPDLALSEAADKDNALRLMPPTYVSLMEVADFSDCQQGRAEIAARDAIIYAPRMVSVEGGACFLYEGDAGYDGLDLEAEGGRHRTYMIDGELRYIREL